MSAWLKALKSMIAWKVPPIDLPAPPPAPPPAPRLDVSDAYESLDNYFGGQEYQLINPKTRDAPLQYAASSVDPKPKQKENPSVLKQAYNTSQDGANAPKIVEEHVEDVGILRKKVYYPQKRLSKKYSAEQLRLLKQTLEIEAASKFPAENVYDDVYDDTVSETQAPQPPPPSEPEKEEEWGYTLDADNYVDMKTIDDTCYETIPELPKQNYYHNIDDRPPLPPKTHLNRSKKSKTKPEPPPKPTHLSVMSAKSPSIGKQYTAWHDLARQLFI